MPTQKNRQEIIDLLTQCGGLSYQNMVNFLYSIPFLNEISGGTFDGFISKFTGQWNTVDRDKGKYDVDYYATDQGSIYKSLVNNNMSTPGVSLTWEKMGAVSTGAFQGAIIPSDTPADLLNNYWWLATEPGTYTDFGGIVVPDNSFAIISYDLATTSFHSSITSIDGFVFGLTTINAVSLINDTFITVGYVGSAGNIDSGDTTWRRTKEVLVNPGERYVFSATNFVPSLSKNLNFYGASGFISNIKVNAIPFYFEVPAGTEYFLLNLKEDGDAIIPSAITLNVSSDVDLIKSINGKSIASSNLVRNRSNKQAVKELVLALSNVVQSQSDNLFDNAGISIGYTTGGGTIENSDTDWKKARIELSEGVHIFTANNPGVFVPTGSKNINFYQENGVWLGNVKATSIPFIFNAPAGTHHLVMNVAYVGDGDNVGAIETAQFQINEGSVLKAYDVFSEGIISAILGYRFPSASGLTSITYTQLKSRISNGTLNTGERIIVTGAPGGKTIAVTATSSSSVSKNIEMINSVDKYDFYELDIANDKIKAFDHLSCVIRNSGGTWGFIDDTDHTPKGFSTIEQGDDYVRVNYSKTYTKVASLSASPDETYTMYGVFAMGASVDLSFSDIKMSCEGIVGSIKEVSGTLEVVNPGFQTSVKSVNMAGDGKITIVHGQSIGSIGLIINSNPNVYFKTVNMDSLTQAVIECRDIATDAVVTVPNGLDFQFMRPGGRLLKHAETQITGSNIWVQGLMYTEFQ